MNRTSLLKAAVSATMLACLAIASFAAEPSNTWGITPADPSSVQRGIDAAYKAGAAKVVIPPGRYVIDHSNDPTTLLRFDRFKNFTISARGVTLVFADRFKHDIFMNGCDNLTFEGPSITRGQIVTSQGTVTAIAPDRKSLDIRIHAGYPTNLTDPRCFDEVHVLTFYRPGSREILPDTYDVWYETPQKMGTDLFRFPLSRPLPQVSRIAVGQYVAWRSRCVEDIVIVNTSHLRFQDITMLGGTGFAVHEHNCDGYNYYQYDVTYPPAPPGATVQPVMSTNLDAFHSSNVRHGPTLENCHFEGMDDDGVPIHGAYCLVMESEGDSVVVNYPDPALQCRPGDRMAFNCLDGSRNDTATIVSIEPISNYPHRFLPTSRYFNQRPSTPLNYHRIKLDHPVAAQFGWMAADLDLCGSGFIVRNCTIKNARARGLLIKASNGLIENCTIEGTTSGGIVLSPELGWNEADYSQNVTIRNNTIRRCGLYMHNGNYETSALTIAAAAADGRLVHPPGHAHIVVEHNKFVDNPGCNILITSAKDVTLKDNTFVRPMNDWDEPAGQPDSLGIDQSAIVNTTLVDGLTISGNTIVDPGKFMKTLEAIGPDVGQTGPSRLVASLNNGVIRGRLTDSKDKPMQGANIGVTLRSLDPSAIGTYTLTGTIPPGTTSALMGIRVNAEGATPGNCDIRVKDISFSAGGQAPVTAAFSSPSALASWSGLNADASSGSAAIDSRSLHLVATKDQALVLNGIAIPITSTGKYRFQVRAAIPGASVDTGYFTLMFMQNGKEFERIRIPFDKPQTILPPMRTGPDGRFSAKAPDGKSFVLQCVYRGDKQHWPACVVVSGR